MKISIIIPAAGLATRNPDKLLTRIDGSYVIEKTVSQFIDFPVNIIIVVGYNKDNIGSTLSKAFGNQIRIVENNSYKNGMGTSLKTGVIASTSETDYFGFCPGDKPFVKKSTIQLLLSKLEINTPYILAPEFNGVLGHPNFFSKIYRNKFTDLETDVGGRKILISEKNNVLTIPVDDRGVVQDMDNYFETLNYREN